MKKTLGIMTSKSGSRECLLPLVKAALQEGFDDCLVFTPDEADLVRRKINGFVYRSGGWVRKVRSFPNIVYDIGYYRLPRNFQKAEEFKASSHIPFVSDWLGNKWVVHHALLASPHLAEHLIDTRLFIHASDAISMLDQYAVVMLKPIHGDSGKGMKRLRRQDGILYIEEDGSSARQVRQRSIAKYLEQLCPRGYILQRNIDLNVKDRRPWDCRALVQKDDRGNWAFTGSVVRTGQTSHMTTHLEKEGEALKAWTFLVERFGKADARTLYSSMMELSIEIAMQLERYFGRDFAEFGIDFAVDEDRSIRILEVDHKPDKQSMKVKDEKELYSKSVRMPMKYAAYLMSSEVQVSKANLPWLRNPEGQTKERIIEHIIEDGMRFYRTPYRFGAKPWSIDAFDCSSFMQYIFARNGLLLPRTSRGQSQLGFDVPKKNLKKGDLLFFTVESRHSKKGIQRIGHVGIYCGGNKFLHSCKAGGVVETDLSDPLWKGLYIKARRIIEQRKPSSST